MSHTPDPDSVSAQFRQAVGLPERKSNSPLTTVENETKSKGSLVDPEPEEVNVVDPEAAAEAEAVGEEPEAEVVDNTKAANKE